MLVFMFNVNTSTTGDDDDDDGDHDNELKLTKYGKRNKPTMTSMIASTMDDLLVENDYDYVKDDDDDDHLQQRETFL